jgi:hypothetical protein
LEFLPPYSALVARALKAHGEITILGFLPPYRTLVTSVRSRCRSLSLQFSAGFPVKRSKGLAV